MTTAAAAPTARRRVHYLGSSYASRTACGLFVPSETAGPLTSPALTAVTCRACLRVA